MGTKKYVEIIDKGECLSTINVPPVAGMLNWNNLENIKSLAGKNEWAKHNFYPSNGLIGEIQGILHNTLWGFDVYVIKIENKYYVPMSPKGIKFISTTEISQKPSNEIKGMDDQQKKINKDFDQLINRPFSIGKQKYTEYFKQDIVSNIKKTSNNFTRQLFLNEIEKEARMYSCDICLEFYEKSGGILTKDWIQHIVSEVCDVMEEFFKEFNIDSRSSVMNNVLILMDDKHNARQLVERFYNRL